MSSLDKSNTNSFLQLLKATYAEYKKNYQTERSIFQTVPILNNKQKRSEKTRSRSRKKSSSKLSLMGREIKRSARLNTIRGNIEEFVELEKEPLWNPHKRKSKEKSSKQKKLQVKQFKIQSHKIKSTDPLYEFYSQPAQNSLNKEAPFPETNQIRPEQQHSPPPPILIPLPQPIQPTEPSSIDQQLENWQPTKQQISMLAIQTLIDEYIIFKDTLRTQTQQIKFTDLAKYVREIKGYYFNINVMNQMIEINPKLYRLVNINGDRYLKYGHLTLDCVKLRQLQTKIKMYRREVKGKGIEDQ